MTKELVVCYYSGDLSWLKEVQGFQKIHVFDKSNRGLGINQENIGREHYTYLRYILDRYDSLPDMIVFAQGEPLDHRENFVDVVNQLPDGIEFLPLGSWYVESDAYGYPHEQLLYGGIPLARIYKELFEREFPGKLWCYANSMFAVSKSRILSRSQEFYRKMLSYVDYDHTPVEVHVLERIWHVVLGEPINYPELQLSLNDD